MASKPDADDLLSHLEPAGSPSETDARRLDALTAAGVDPPMAARLVESGSPEALDAFLDLLHTVRQEAGEMGALARQLREDLRAASAEVRRLEGELAAARQNEGSLREDAGGPEPARAQLAARVAELEGRLEDERMDALRALETSASDAKAEAEAALRNQWEARIDELRRGHDDALAALQRRHAEEIGALRKAHEAAIADLDTAQYAAVKRASDDRWARMQRVQEDLRQHYESRLAESLARAAKDIEEAERGHAMDLRAREERLRAERAQAVAAGEDEWKARLERLQGEQGRALAALEEGHRSEIAALQGARDELLAAKEKELLALRRAAEESASKMATFKRLQDETRQQHESKLAEVRAAPAEELKRLQDELAGLDAEWKEKHERQRRAHAMVLAALRQQHERELGAARTPASPPLAGPAAAAPQKPAEKALHAVTPAVPRQAPRPTAPPGPTVTLPVAAPSPAPPPGLPPPAPSPHAAEDKTAESRVVVPAPPRKPPAPARRPSLLLVAGGVTAFALAVLVVGLAISRARGSRPAEAAAPSAPPATAETPRAPAGAQATPAPAAPVQKELGWADILSKPEGATVTIAGNIAGQTPLTGLEVWVGTYPLQIAKAGHRPWAGSLVVEAGLRATIDVELTPLTPTSGGAATRP